MRDVVSFHAVHGSAVTLSSHSSRASRGLPHSVKDALVFSAHPLAVQQRALLRVTSPRQRPPLGALRIGLTKHDPAGLAAGGSLPPYLIPNLTTRGGCWARPMDDLLGGSGEEWEVVLYFNAAGVVYYVVDGVWRGVLMSGVAAQRPLWLVVDLYGKTTAVSLARASEDPEEVVARGPGAVRSYRGACEESGARALHRSRLVLLGPCGAGRGRLRERILRRDSPWVALDLSAAPGTVDLSARAAWRQGCCAPPALPPDPPSTAGSSADRMTTEEVNRAIATNLCLQILHLLRAGGGSGGTNSSARDHSGSHLVSSRSEPELARDISIKGGGGSGGEGGGGAQGGDQPPLQDAGPSKSIDGSHRTRTKFRSVLRPLQLPVGATAKHKSWRSGATVAPMRATNAHLGGALSNSRSYASHALLKGSSEQVIALVDSIMASLAPSSPEGAGARRTKGQQRSRSAGEDAEGVDAPAVSPRGGVEPPKVLLEVLECRDDAAHFTANKIFLSSRAIYLLVFDLSCDLDSIDSGDTDEGEERRSSLESIDYWLNTVHAFAGRCAPQTAPLGGRLASLTTSPGGRPAHATPHKGRGGRGEDSILPQVFLVGMQTTPPEHSRDVEGQFERLRTLVRGKVYEKHVAKQFFTVKVDGGGSLNDTQVQSLLDAVEEALRASPHMGEFVPERWVQLEAAVDQLIDSGTYLCSLGQLREVTSNDRCSTNNEFSTMLHFLHDTGRLILHGGAGNQSALHGGTGGNQAMSETVVLHPSWLVAMATLLLYQPGSSMAHIERAGGEAYWQQYRESGILFEPLIDLLWAESLAQKHALLSVLSSRLDLLAERHPGNNSGSWDRRLGRSFIVPSVVRRQKPSANQPSSHDSPTNHDVVFYFDFNGFLPDALFGRLVVRTCAWVHESGAAEPRVWHRHARFLLDSEHDFSLALVSSPPMRIAWVKVTVMRLVDLDRADDDSTCSLNESASLQPKPSATAKVRNFLELTLCELRETWVKRIHYNTCVCCACDKTCVVHARPSCAEEECTHFLSLDECLSNKIVCCEHRRIKTGPYCRGFPQPTQAVSRGPIISELPADINSKLDLPAWVKNAAKMLNGGTEGRDWIALAKKLGYRKAKVEKFNNNLNPGLALLSDWIISSGNTSLSVDLMVTYLEQMQRDDIVEVVQKGQEVEVDPPQVFISYQWDIQDEVTLLRDVLETHGLTCWMDIGQMGGGDLLYAKIYDGIKNSKVTIACLTPKYVVSHHCARELSLADLLQKPIIPVLYDKLGWPPSGAMSLIFAQLIYVNLKGVGGHGGSGAHADLNAKYQEIVARVSNYATPHSRPFVKLSPRSAAGGKGNAGTGIKRSMFGVRVGAQNPTEAQAVRTEGRLRGERASGGAGGTTRGGGVEQVNVRQCGVCAIL